MSEATTLLDQLSDAELAAYSEDGPIDDVILIDARGRLVNVPSTELLFGVETDQETERKYFRCPRIVGDNIDLSTLSLRVHYSNANGEKDKYLVDDVQVDGNYITFSWQLKEKVLRYKGAVKFIICAVKSEANGTLKNRWNTTLASGTVLEGLPVDDLDPTEEATARDVIAQLLDLLQTRADASVQAVEDKGDEVIRNISEQTFVAKRLELTLPTADWDYSSEYGYYRQTVTVEGSTIHSKIDLQPTSQQLVELINNGISMFVANEDGVINVYAIGGNPGIDMTIQATKMEVVFI